MAYLVTDFGPIIAAWSGGNSEKISSNLHLDDAEYQRLVEAHKAKLASATTAQPSPQQR